MLSNLVGPVGEAQPTERMLRCTSRYAIRLAASLLDLAHRLLPRAADADVEAGRVEPHVRAHDSAEQDVAGLVVHRVVPVHPLLLDQAALQTEVRGDGGDLAGVVALVAADRDERVRSLGEGVGDDVFQLASLVATERQPRVDVLSLGPDPGAAEVIAQAVERMHGAGTEREFVPRKVSDAHNARSLQAGEDSTVVGALRFRNG